MAIFGHISDVSDAIKANPNFQIAFDYLIRCIEKGSVDNRRIMSMKAGEVFKFDISDTVFAMEQSYRAKKRADARFESHRKYIDIQCLIGGEEMMEELPVGRLAVATPYNADDDVIFYEDSNDSFGLKVSDGGFAIFYPDDAHMPCIEAGNGQVFKTVVKVPVG